MDSFEINKYFGAITGALMVFLAISFLTEGLYGGGHEGGHGEERHLAFAMAIEEGEGGGEAEAAPEVSLAELIADADAGAGERVFKKCAACHAPEQGGANKIGPALYGVVGRPVGTHEGFSYSDEMASLGGDWSWEHLDEFLASPKSVVPGTKMSFAGLRKPEDRANVMVFLNEHSDSPLPPPSE